jgi:hypothetical protein
MKGLNGSQTFYEHLLDIFYLAGSLLQCIMSTFLRFSQFYVFFFPGAQQPKSGLAVDPFPANV